MTNLDNSLAQALARRRLLLRCLSFALALPMLGAVLFERHAPRWQWEALVGCCLCLPALVRVAGRWLPRRRTMRTAEILLGHLLGGAWAALSAFNLLPCVAGIAFLGMDAMQTGGRVMLVRGLTAYAIGAVLGAIATGFDWHPTTSLMVMMASLPLLLVHPFIIACAARETIVESARRHDLLERQSRYDGLSGLYNRTHWETLVRDEFARCRASARPCTLVMADLDHFKRINDTHGHEAGDDVIRAFAQLLRAQLRPADVCGRYGGEEFGVLMPGTSATEAHMLIERLRQRLHDQSLLESCPPVTASFGIAPWMPDVDSHEAWMRLSDQMLYRAKHLGRDRVAVLGSNEQAVVPQVIRQACPDFTPAPSLRDPRAMPHLQAGLQLTRTPIAMFDPSDRLAYANPAFRELYHVAPGEQTFADIMRRCQVLGVGPRIETDDIGAWLRKAESKRLSRPHRTFAVDLTDGRWFQVVETLFDDGWLMLSMTDLTQAGVAPGGAHERAPARAPS